MVTELTVPVGEEQVKVVAAESATPLGRLTWYGCAEQTIPFADLEDKLRAASVPEELWPRHTSPSDAFRRAVRDVQGSDYLVDNESTVDAAGKRKKDSKAMLVVERVHDQAKDALPVAVKVRYLETKGGAPSLWFDPSQGFDPAKAAELETRIRRDWNVYRDSFTADDVRAMIVRALHAAYAVMVKKAGGVYFVPERYSPGVNAVAKVVESLPGAEMVAVTVVDAEPERKTVLKRYEKATLERIEELMLQVHDIVTKAEPIVPSVLARVVEELEYLREQKGKYEEFLAVTMGKVDVEMQILQSETAKLAPLVKSK